MLMDNPRFNECLFVDYLEGHNDPGSSTYMCPKELYDEIFKWQHHGKLGKENQLGSTATVCHARMHSRTPDSQNKNPLGGYLVLRPLKRCAMVESVHPIWGLPHPRHRKSNHDQRARLQNDNTQSFRMVLLWRTDKRKRTIQNKSHCILLTVHNSIMTSRNAMPQTYLTRAVNKAALPLRPTNIISTIP